MIGDMGKCDMFPFLVISWGFSCISVRLAIETTHSKAGALQATDARRTGSEPLLVLSLPLTTPLAPRHPVISLSPCRRLGRG